MGDLGLGHAALRLLVDLVSDHHEGEVVRVARVRLGEELLSPAVELFKGLLRGDVMHQNAGIGTAVEGHTKTLESLLAGGIPNLRARRRKKHLVLATTSKRLDVSSSINSTLDHESESQNKDGLWYLQSYELVVDHNLFRQEIGADRGFILTGEALVHILVHQGGLSDSK